MAGSAAAASFLPQALVPVVLDIDSAGARYVDSLLWSVSEREMTPEQFASATCADLRLPGDFAALIASSIRQQLQHAAALVRHATCRELDEDPLLPRHVVLRVDVLFNGQRFRDDVRWDTRCPRNTPEAVARQTCADLALAKPFDAAIAFAMRRELVRAALGCAAVDPRGTPRASSPATLPRQDTLMTTWRPRTSSVLVAAAPRTVDDSSLPSVARPPQLAPALAGGGAAATNTAPVPMAADARSSVQQTGEEKTPRAINPYIMFSSRHRGRVSQENPSLSTVEISRIMGELWRSMSSDKREMYERLAREENVKRLAGVKKPLVPGVPQPAGGSSSRSAPAQLGMPPPMQQQPQPQHQQQQQQQHPPGGLLAPTHPPSHMVGPRAQHHGASTSARHGGDDEEA
ncbi:hypothetical protein CTAYLR_002071 [Chrysophaeum taylorii]|uniref:HMG box domain-containing protein n=1 Tax=Chrysophaeum taylorii TaxID=2483200 RepID=A0AAD7UP66_9STRA|nr:hypothetical protein CTAYLR_002071 [Chrysophaeum taylorii]